jgi:hypothetical protein
LARRLRLKEVDGVVVVVLMLEEVVSADVAGDPRECLLDFYTVER